MPRESTSAGERNALLAVAGLVVIAGGTALACALICDFTLEAFGSSRAMVALLTADGSVVMDDKTTEANLARATAAFRVVRDVAWALAIGCLGVGGATLARLGHKNALVGTPEG